MNKKRNSNSDMNNEQLALAHSEWVATVINLQHELSQDKVSQELFRILTIEASDKYYRRVQDILNLFK